MRNHQKSRHILDNPHAMVGMRIFNEGWRWDYTIEKVSTPYFYPYAVCLEHQDRPRLWAVCYDQNDALLGRNPILLRKEYCAYCVAEFIAYEHVSVIQENGYGIWKCE